MVIYAIVKLQAMCEKEVVDGLADLMSKAKELRERLK